MWGCDTGLAPAAIDGFESMTCDEYDELVRCAEDPDKLGYSWVMCYEPHMTMLHSCNNDGLAQ